MTVAVLRNKPSLIADLPTGPPKACQTHIRVQNVPVLSSIYRLKTRGGADFINTQNNEVINKTF